MNGSNAIPTPVSDAVDNALIAFAVRQDEAESHVRESTPYRHRGAVALSSWRLKNAQRKLDKSDPDALMCRMRGLLTIPPGTVSRANGWSDIP